MLFISEADGQRQEEIFHWVQSLNMCCGLSWELESHSRSLMWVIGIKSLESSLLLSSVFISWKFESELELGHEARYSKKEHGWASQLALSPLCQCPAQTSKSARGESYALDLFLEWMVWGRNSKESSMERIGRRMPNQGTKIRIKYWSDTCGHRGLILL